MTQTEECATALGQIVKLDRGFPLVRLANGEEVRCKHATALVKGEKVRAVIGDMVEISIPEGNDNPLIASIMPRTSTLVRKDPTERALPQVLAANFHRVIIAQPVGEVNLRRLERELVLAHETGVAVTVVLTKADLAENNEADDAVARVKDLAGDDVGVLLISAEQPQTVEQVRELIPEGETCVLMGRSGVGKSSLVNLLVGSEVAATGDVREGDGKGRHTTVSREMVRLPGGGTVVDMPGVRGLGLWDAEDGIAAAFSDIEEYAQECRFRDCKHVNEPGCAVLAAIENGGLSQSRYDSYQALAQEQAGIRERREQARWMQAEQRGAHAGARRTKPKKGRGKKC